MELGNCLLVACHLQLPAAPYLTNPISSGPSSLELFTKLLSNNQHQGKNN
jgi:hypothetical protein